jgi:DNA recombination protein RmuC
MNTITLVAALVALVLGLAVGYAIGLGRRERVPLEADLAGRLGAAEARAQALSQENLQLRGDAARDQDLLRAFAPIQAKLTDVERHVATLETERAAQYAALNQQLLGAQATDRELRAVTGSLAGSLRSSSARGTWGEVELRRVLELSGLTNHIDFVEQGSLRSDDGGRGRPDVIVTLPGGKYVAIDAKAPMAAYLGPVGSGLEGDGERDAPGHAKALRAHVDALAKRNYPGALGASPDFTVMFLPMESLLSAALGADPGLLDYAMAKGITPATPTSLLALLKTVAVMWRQTTVTEQAAELLDLGKSLYERLGVFAGHVGKVGSALESAVVHYNRMVGSLESRVLVTCRSFDGFDASKLTAMPVSPEKAQVKHLSAPEFAGAFTADSAGGPGHAR